MNEDMERESGISFCIITGGQRFDMMENLIQSIAAQNVPSYEIIVCGNYREDPRIRFFEKKEWAENAEVCKMRNFAAARARFDTIIILDDDVEFAPDWYEKIKRENDFDLAGCKGLLPDSRRCWDYQKMERGNPLAAPVPLDYGEDDPDAYISGYFMMMRAKVWKAVKFDENRRNYQHDDVDFCHRATDIGFSLKIFPNATVIHHMDPRGRDESEKARANFIEEGASSGLSDYEEGMKRLLLKDYKSAISAFKKSVADKSDFNAFYHLAYCHQQIGALNNAARYYLKAVETPGENDGSRMAAALFHLGEIYAEKEIWYFAEYFFEKALIFSPGHRKAARILAELRADVAG